MTTNTIKLRELAHARAGDKGDISNLSLIAYDTKDYALLLREVTPERVRAHFEGVVKGSVTRYELPQLGAIELRDVAGKGAVFRFYLPLAGSA